MKSIIRCFFLFLILILFFGCDRLVKNTLKEKRSNLYFGLTEKQKKDREFYYSISNLAYRVEEINERLMNGQNPNSCYGECGWIESNPLLLISQYHYDIYYREKYGQDIPEPTPDILVFNLLIDYGADINMYPYIYIIVYTRTDHRKRSNKEELLYIEGSNKILKEFLEKGADPNAKGNHRAFDWQTYDDNLSYEAFQKMCKEPDATSPLYEAIKKGIKWESQVDLLLEYGAILDESCLEAAKLSGDKEMMEKINSLYNKE